MTTAIRTVLFITTALAVASGQQASEPRSEGGIYSAQATAIWRTHTSLVLKSPDGNKAIIVHPIQGPIADEIHSVTVRANGREYRTLIGSWVNAEAAWSPDSTAFFVTYSDGGSIGTYHVSIVYVSQDGLQFTEPIPNGRRLFAPNCFDAEVPNVAAIKWDGRDASTLLIAVQVPPHGSCQGPGTFRAFAISARDGAVMKSYSQLSAKRLFGSGMGVELKNADDDCVRRPASCVPPGLKPRL